MDTPNIWVQLYEHMPPIIRAIILALVGGIAYLVRFIMTRTARRFEMLEKRIDSKASNDVIDNLRKTIHNMEEKVDGLEENLGGRIDRVYELLVRIHANGKSKD